MNLRLRHQPTHQPGLFTHAPKRDRDGDLKVKGKESPLRLKKNLTTIGKKDKDNEKEKRKVSQLKMGEALKGWLKNEKPTEQHENPEKTKKN